MVKKRFSLLFSTLVLVFTLMLLPAAYAESPRDAEFRTCLDSKTSAEDCNAAISRCNGQLDERYEYFNNKYSTCTPKCSDVKNNCITDKCSSDGCYPPDGCGDPGGFNTGRKCSSGPSERPTCSDGRSCSCSSAKCKIDCEDSAKSCYDDCQKVIAEKNAWWGSDTQTSDGYAEGNSEIQSLSDNFMSECEAAKPQEAAETELQAAADEGNELQAEVESLLDEIAEVCLG